MNSQTDSLASASPWPGAPRCRRIVSLACDAAPARCHRACPRCAAAPRPEPWLAPGPPCCACTPSDGHAKCAASGRMLRWAGSCTAAATSLPPSAAACHRLLTAPATHCHPRQDLRKRLRVVTLNAWGLWLVSRRRAERMAALAAWLRRCAAWCRLPHRPCAPRLSVHARAPAHAHTPPEPSTSTAPQPGVPSRRGAAAGGLGGGRRCAAAPGGRRGAPAPLAPLAERRHRQRPAAAQRAAHQRGGCCRLR